MSPATRGGSRLWAGGSPSLGPVTLLGGPVGFDRELMVVGFARPRMNFPDLGRQNLRQRRIMRGQAIDDSPGCLERATHRHVLVREHHPLCPETGTSDRAARRIHCQADLIFHLFRET